jgi:hypothetical protein
MPMKIETAAAVALAVVCPASADTRISVSQQAEVGAATSRVIALRRARGGSVVRSSVDTDVERAIATLTFDLAASSSNPSEVSVPVRIRGGARVIGMSVTAGGEALITRTLSSVDAWNDYRRLTAPGPEADPALLRYVGTRDGLDELQLRVFPLTKERVAHIELTVALPTDGWSISPPEEPYVSRGVAMLAVEPPRTRAPIVIACGVGVAHGVGELDKTIIRRHVKRNLPRVRGCYERGLLSNPALAGGVELHFTIAPDGRTSSVSVDGALDAPAVRACIAEDLASWEFPAVPEGSATRVNYPITLVAR